MTKDSSTESKGFARRLLQDIKTRLSSLLSSDVKEIDVLEHNIAAITVQQNTDPDRDSWFKNEDGNLVRFSELKCKDQSIQDMSTEKMNR